MTRVTFDGKHWFVGNERLSGTHAKIFIPLLFKRAVNIEHILVSIWPDPDEEPDNAYNQLSVNVNKLNKKLLKCGAGVKVRGNGKRQYTIEKLPIQAGSA